jgi:hypothetical protein
MKRKELIKRINAVGCVLVRHGKRDVDEKYNYLIIKVLE